jgi:type II secretory ATPase GspE/PulE/Tfp pilus assembly ATPase PilB-like protein
MLQEFTDTAIDFTETEDDTATSGDAVDENSAPVVRLVHLMISEAVQLRASDIHIEPFEDRIRIRYRIDGVLIERDSPPRRLLGALLSRVKILSKLDIAERRRPQDGRIKVTVGDKELDLRVSVIPTSHGQSVVMRLLDSIGVDFARIIRAMLRQAPNIILVGEMRDNETASMGIQASLTGHLVFSTLHTNDAPTAMTRMTDMGVPGYLVASSVIGVLAQRLVRIVCGRCKQKYTPPESMLEAVGISLEDAKNANFSRGAGCNYCQKKGFRGRKGIFELMMVTGKIRQLMFEGAPTQDLRIAAISEGMSTLYQDGLRKALEGLTTLDEVLRVAKKTEQDDQ